MDAKYIEKRMIALRKQMIAEIGKAQRQKLTYEQAIENRDEVFQSPLAFQVPVWGIRWLDGFHRRLLEMPFPGSRIDTVLPVGKDINTKTRYINLRIEKQTLDIREAFDKAQSKRWPISQLQEAIKNAQPTARSMPRWASHYVDGYTNGCLYLLKPDLKMGRVLNGVGYVTPIPMSRWERGVADMTVPDAGFYWARPVTYKHSERKDWKRFADRIEHKYSR